MCYFALDLLKLTALKTYAKLSFSSGVWGCIITLTLESWNYRQNCMCLCDISGEGPNLTFQDSLGLLTSRGKGLFSNVTGEIQWWLCWLLAEISSREGFWVGVLTELCHETPLRDGGEHLVGCGRKTGTELGTNWPIWSDFYSSGLRLVSDCSCTIDRVGSGSVRTITVKEK